MPIASKDAKQRTNVLARRDVCIYRPLEFRIYIPGSDVCRVSQSASQGNSGLSDYVTAWRIRFGLGLVTGQVPSQFWLDLAHQDAGEVPICNPLP